MMELNDSTTDAADQPPLRSLLSIDLNEIPSPAEIPADSVDVVRSFHDNPSPPPGAPAGVPSPGNGSVCAVCGRPEDFGYVVVCDACERGFHVGCAGMRGGGGVGGGVGGGLVSINEEWLCGECVSAGEKSKRWPLGAKKRLLDMNASPPSDGDGDDEVLETRKHSSSNSFGGHPLGAPATYPNTFFGGNGFGFQKPPHTAKVGFEEILNRSLTRGRSFDEVDLNFPGGKYRSNGSSSSSGNNNTGVRKLSRNPSDSFLQALREFVFERHGELEEGWRVEFKQTAGSELYAVYCAPDGKTFDSVYEVDCYLGLTSKCDSKDLENNSNSNNNNNNNRTLLPKKRKARRSMNNGFPENKDLATNGLGMKRCSSEGAAGESGCSESHNNNEGLPVQFEDFFLLSLGKVDPRPSYHNANFIWPVGFKSCWHDKLTGSLFLCEVSDGGEGGPVFKVKRVPCSSVPIPMASTVLLRQQTGPADEESDAMSCDNDESIQMLLSDSLPPVENDILSCLKTSNHFSSPVRENSENVDVTSCKRVLGDEIGEFSAEEKSSPSLAWKMVAQKIVGACSEILERKSTSDFLCKHVRNDGSFPNYVRNKGPLDKFSSAPGSPGVQSVIKAGKEPESLKNVLEKWLDQDRFGLDLDFVHEILEQLPGFQICSQYQMLSERSSCSSPVTVGNGLVALKMKGSFEGKERETRGLFRRWKKAKVSEGNFRENRRRPDGKKLCSAVPSELAGVVYQVWELLWRFYETLGMKEPLELEELEEELMNPWSDNSDLLEKFEKEIRSSQVLNSTGSTDGQTLTSTSESGSAVSRDEPHAFIQMTTREMKEAAQTKLASFTYNRCSGVALTKAHKSLLRVLIGELQSKVASLVDPNFDSGEAKSKRGRKKDVDSSSSAKRTKLNILPINELTWPELARRYILAVLSMDGNVDSAEIIARESGKVFRCLQGDGGVLCGSLTGVAAMEADALLLAEARKKVFGSGEKENDVITFEDEGSEATGASEKNAADDGNVPEWAHALEPVRKLPTNVGTRIRKCVYEALAMNPPEWAKKILEHSISKEVYKGNASGPTKKAVLSVLADVSGQVLPPKPENKRKKKKTVISISDVIMKQCRIVLRRAAAADDSKVFCNLLGRKLSASSDNDDEGLLGSPAMVSRPLDFRTIDLRLAAGSYCGLHEPFLEDVRELWNNIRIAFGDQPDLFELAETLSENFEQLFEKEVLPFVEKFAGFAKLESFNAERKKEISDLLSSISVIPKAPWDDGVCKVCGIDRDDDSVLLCDTCDAEYHTYCLNPPLARIPEGNWYCPSCVLSKCIVAPENVHVIRQRSGKKYQGEITRVFLEGLAHLATKMEEKEYWEFGLDERMYLLKFLSDDLLNSAVIRQHIEQCAETSTELQQKLRSLFVEWKILKTREDILASRASKLDPIVLNPLPSAFAKESPIATHEKAQAQSLSDKSNCLAASADDVSTLVGGLNALDRHSSASDSQHSSQNLLDPEDQLKDGHASVVESNAPTNTNMDSQKNDKPHEAETSSTDMKSNSVSHELQTYQVELTSVRNEIAVVQESITSVESELLKVSVRREFLGRDSSGCLYWASGTPTGQYWIIVDGTAIFQGPMWRNPHMNEKNSPNVTLSVSYQTEEEIDELVRYLSISDPKERELKESLMHWQKLRFQEFRKLPSLSSAPATSGGGGGGGKDELIFSDHLATRASNLLEKRHGACVELEAADTVKKRGRKYRASSVEDKMYRCECFEPVWSSRHHCISCHRTFLDASELEDHNEGKCITEKGKETSDLSSKVKGHHRREAPQTGCPDITAKLIKCRDEGSVCPHDLEKISAKFVTKDSCKDLINDIGLIGSNGVVPFVPFRSSAADSTSQSGGCEAVEKLALQGNGGVDVLSSRSPKRTVTKDINEVSRSQRTGARGSGGRSGASTGITRHCVVPQTSLRLLVGKVSMILRRLKINLLDMEAALPEEALRPPKGHLGKRPAWRAFVKSATTIYEMIQATMILEDMIKTDSIKNEWWYWSSFSAAAKTSTVSALALRIYSLDAAILYEKTSPDSDPPDNADPTTNLSEQKPPPPVSDPAEKTRASRRSSKKRKESEG